MNAGRILATMALLATVGSVAQAQSANQTVNFEVTAINQLSVGGAVTLTVNTATAGSAPSAATTNSSYAITTNGTNMKITAGLDADMPAGLTLTANLTAPGVGSSAGVKTLADADTDVVTGITQVNASGVAIAYSLSATLAAGVVSSASRTVTYTITAGS